MFDLESNATILFVDDEINVLNSLKRLFRREPYTVLTASNSDDGLKYLQQRDVQLVVSDQRMPDVSGTEFLQQVKEQHPNTVRVILSGYADTHVILEAINKGEVYRFLTKPWVDDDLKVAIKQCLAHYSLIEANFNLIDKVNAQSGELLNLDVRLETMIHDRTRSLQMTQNMVTELPVPVIGVSCEGLVVLITDKMRRLFPSMRDAKLGQPVDQLWPTYVLDAVGQHLNGSVKEQWYPFQKDGLEGHLFIKSLYEPNGNIRGCVMLVEGKVA